MSRKQKRVFWPALALIVLTVATIALVSARANNPGGTSGPQVLNTAELSGSAVSAPLQGDLSQDRIEAELITILPTGFEPAEIRRPAGKFLLAIDNRSGLTEVNVRLLRLVGRSTQELRIRRERPDLRKVVDLEPGAYLLTEANHPDWIGRLIITVP